MDRKTTLFHISIILVHIPTIDNLHESRRKEKDHGYPRVTRCVQVPDSGKNPRGQHYVRNHVEDNDRILQITMSRTLRGNIHPRIW
jgi:hypothetical protein